MGTKKILFGSIFVLALILLMPSIPAIQQYNKEFNEFDNESLDLVGRIITRGCIGILPQFYGDNITFLVLRCHYTVFTGTIEDSGIIRLRCITLP